MCKCCFGNIEGESCGWPKGTVRAIVALTTILLAFGAAGAVVGVLLWKEQYTAATGVIGTMFGVVGTIIYFGTKQAEGAAKLISKNEHELIESHNLDVAERRNERMELNRDRGLNRDYNRYDNRARYEDVRIHMNDLNDGSDTDQGSGIVVN